MKWTVYMLTPYAEWNNIEGVTAEEAIKQCDAPEFDMNDGPIKFLAKLEDDEEEDEG